ncbi:MAG: 5-carboxymethyl-2-hydroxymuconate semialdehyde dehydrogenase [Gammaproteobacteria bacterium]|nr:5-carboxymethyl-2-hydroxymuconate semialdehyde dehydrogenase [Gammaproteobacteria bacterium]MDD9957657.1 5-carboxymethyl-2-hydroxymuconate semialdehyde dehydrogenase [Gammaproteobacteria bacterium]
MSQESLEENLRKLQPLLKEFAAQPIQHCINGEAVASADGGTFSNHSPIDESIIGEVAAGNVDDIDKACRAAEEAFVSWASMAGKQRRDLLHAIADAIEANAESIALVESWDTGQPLRFMSKAAIRGAENYRFFADMAPNARNGLSLPAQHHMNYSVRQPIGPVGIITPWNTPFMLSTWKIAPALAAGCTVVHKPAEWSPCSASMLVKIMLDAGLPKGVVNTVQGIGEVAGKALTEHAAIKAIAFVGESRTGSEIMKQGAATLKRVHFELGGKNPVIVFDDADLDRALDAVIFMIYSLNGERCTSSSRLLIQKGIAGEFIECVKERVAKLKLGHPLNPATEVGPLIHEKHREKVASYFDIAQQEGANIAIGGSKAAFEGKGCFVEPTLFTNANNSMRIAQEEIFGPVLTAIEFEDEKEAIAIANGVNYGLAAYVWTGDAGRSIRLGRDLDAGMIWINSENNRHLPSPFGGMKASGIGRDGGDYSFDFYMETKNVCIATNNHSVPKLAKN